MSVVTRPVDVPTNQADLAKGWQADMRSYVRPHFFVDHSGKKGRVPVSLVTVGPFGIQFKMICYAIPQIAVDFDGAPDAYAPPISATNHHPKGGLKAKDDIRNARNDAHAPFHENGHGNTFHWTGVVNRAQSKHPHDDEDLDTRPFLSDVHKHFPVVESEGTYAGFYKPKSHRGLSGAQINASNTCYGVLSHSLATVGVEIGDVGVIINMKSGAGTPFMYCDAAGAHSVGVSEFSDKVSAKLGGDSYPVCVFSFPGSAIVGGSADPGKTDELISQSFRKAPAEFILGPVVSRLVTHTPQQSLVRACLGNLGLYSTIFQAVKTRRN